MERLWEYGLHERLRAQDSENAVLVAEPSLARRSDRSGCDPSFCVASTWQRSPLLPLLVAGPVGREKWCEILFEKHGVPAVFFGKEGVLAWCVRRTARVVAFNVST